MIPRGSWTREEMARALKLRQGGTMWTEIGKILRRPASTVSNMIKPLYDATNVITDDFDVPLKPDGLPWTKDEDEQLIAFYRCGLVYREIGKRIGRKQSSVSARVSRLRNQGLLKGRSFPTGLIRSRYEFKKPLSVGVIGQRRCLQCGKTFKSFHVGNRLCNRCIKYAAGQRGGFDDTTAFG